MSRTGKSIETESRLVIVKGYRERGDHRRNWSVGKGSYFGVKKVFYN